MFDKINKHKFFQKTMRLKRFFFMFTLRQGTILIAVHQIALSALLLIILLTGLSHVDSMMTMLHRDMADDAETREYYRKVLHGEESVFVHRGDPVHSLNDKMFSSAEHLASETVEILYSSTTFTAIYLLCCISLLHGAIKYKRGYMIPWVAAAIIGFLFSVMIMSVGERCAGIIDFFGGYKVYYLCCTIFAAIFIYAILTVASFVIQVDDLRPDVCGSVSHDHIVSKPRPKPRGQKYELGERMVLIDHAAQSSVLSSTQLNKLSLGMQSQFV